jgi:hypothetical protein
MTVPQFPVELWADILWKRAMAMAEDEDRQLYVRSIEMRKESEREEYDDDMWAFLQDRADNLIERISERYEIANEAWATCPQYPDHAPSDVVRSRWGDCWPSRV